MRVEDIIEGLNRHIEYKRELLGVNTTGHLVLQKSINPHSTFKAYKEYNYSVWFVKNRKKYRVITVNIVDKVLEGQEETIIRRMNTELCTNIFNLIGSEVHNQIVNGEYGYKDE